MDKTKIYNIGQELVIKEDIEQEMCFGTKKTRKKGTKLYVGADSNFSAGRRKVRNRNIKDPGN
jgi:hypothetical protein